MKFASTCTGSRQYERPEESYMIFDNNGSKMVHTSQFLPKKGNFKHQIVQGFSLLKAVDDRALGGFIIVDC